MRLYFRLALSLPVIMLVAWLFWHSLHPVPKAKVLENGAELVWGDCWFSEPLWRPVYCGRFKTSPEGDGLLQQFELPVVYFPTLFWHDKRDPVLYISGGPGGSSWLSEDEISPWYAWLDEVDWQRDVVLYDQRGVGLSQPALSCPELDRLREALLPKNISTQEASALMAEKALECRHRLQRNGIDFARFNTRTNAHDAHDLMLSMGHSRWDVFGVSYGTRVALELMRMAPNRIGAAVLDSVYPPQVSSELSDPWLLGRVVQMVPLICELATDCAMRPSELLAFLERAVERLQKKPLRFHFVDTASQQFRTVLYTYEDFIWLLFESMYQWHLLADLPEVIRSVALGQDNPVLHGMVKDSVENYLGNSISDPVANAVDCNDAPPVTQKDFNRQRKIYGDPWNILAHSWSNHACRYWKDNDEAKQFRQPVVSDIPTLLLSGEFDPVTPPEWASLAAQNLPNSLLFQFPSIGHGALDSHVCAVDVVRQFWLNGLNSIPPDCLGDL